jgi:hypothetical protein
MRFAQIVSYAVVGALIVADGVYRMWRRLVWRWWIARWRARGGERRTMGTGARVVIAAAATAMVCIAGTRFVIGVWPIEEAPVVIETPRDAFTQQAMSGRGTLWTYHDSTGAVTERVPVAVFPDSLEAAP